MAKQRDGQSPADFLRERGWDRPGTVLYGSPITHAGKVIEGGREFRITAVGESAVLARTRGAGKSWPFSYEHSVVFDMRDWSLSASADTGSES